MSITITISKTFQKYPIIFSPAKVAAGFVRNGAGLASSQLYDCHDEKRGDMLMKHLQLTYSNYNVVQCVKIAISLETRAYGG